METPNTLRRYTDLPALVYLLENKAITLLDPIFWDDKNDIYYLEQYKNRKLSKGVLALCFTEASETYHHWKVFAGGGASGVCIVFYKDKLLDAISHKSTVLHRQVVYKTMKEMREEPFDTEDLPFLKRYGFQDEQEFRIIHELPKTSKTSVDIPIPLSCIERVVINPWIHQSLSDSVKRLIRGISGCNKLKLTRSTLTNNAQWKSYATA